MPRRRPGRRHLRRSRSTRRPPSWRAGRAAVHRRARPRRPRASCWRCRRAGHARRRHALLVAGDVTHRAGRRHVHLDDHRPRARADRQLRALGMVADDDPLAPYRDAQRLIRELLDLSGDLGSGPRPDHARRRRSRPRSATSSRRRRRRPRAARRRADAAGVRAATRRRSTRPRSSPSARARPGRPALQRRRPRLRLPAASPTPARRRRRRASCRPGFDPAGIGLDDAVSRPARRLCPTARPPRHRAAVRRAPRRGHRRGAAPAGPRDARRRRPGHRLLGYLVDALAASPTAPEQAERCASCASGSRRSWPRYAARS